MNNINKCKICGTEDAHPCYEVKEMFFGTKETFLYFECSNCHCLQICQIPENLGQYYRNDYYSFEPQSSDFLNLQSSDNLNHPEKILDVGCGSGKWLIDRANDGYYNLFGCDPYISENIQYGDRITIRKCTLHEMTGKFDIITFNDSFEHMADPLAELLSVKNLLSPNGMCRISIPVYPNIAHETFGINWFQWDAPRHLFLHSRESMEYLCNQADLVIKKVNYDSNIGQFLISYCYKAGIPMINLPSNIMDSFSPKDIEVFNELTISSNTNECSDHATFLIMHK